MYYFYILYSLKDHRLYKGSCSDFPKRFIRHNSGGNRSTAHRKPLVFIHIEIFEEKQPAQAKEKDFLKHLREVLNSKKLQNRLFP